MTKDELKHLSGEIGGSLCITCVESYATSFLAGIMADFKKKNPNVSFTLISTTSREVLQNVESGMAELGIMRTYAKLDHLEEVELETLNWLVAIPLDHPLAKMEGDYATLEELAKYDLMIPVHGPANKKLRELFENNGLSPNFVCNFEPQLIGFNLVEVGLGIAFVPDSPSNSLYADRVVMKRVEAFDFTSSVSLVYQRYYNLSKVAKLFVAEVLNATL